MVKPLRIVHVISSLKVGGAETVLFTIAQQLKSLPFEQHVIFFHDGPIRQKIEALNIPLYQIKGAIFRYDPIFLFRLIKTLKDLKPNIIHSALWAANFFGILASRLIKIPIVCALHTMREHEGKLRNLLDKFSLQHAQQVIAVSKGIANDLNSEQLIRPTKLTVISNAINSQELIDKAQNSKITRQQLGLEDDHFVIGSVGRFVKVKNYHLLLEAVAPLIRHYPRIRLVLIGLGPEYEALKAQAAQLNISDRVQFLVEKQACDYYSILDCFVQPSQYEGLSIALLEALCLGLPCIATAKNMQHDVIKNEKNGILIEPNNIHQLGRALETLYQNQELRKSISLAGAETVINDYNLDNMIENYKKVFTSKALF